MRAVRDDGAAREQRAERVRAVEAVAPEPLREVAVRRRVAELDGARHAQLRETRKVGGIEALRVIDPLAEPERLPDVACRLERPECLAIGAVADRVDGDRPARGGRDADELRELLAARDADPAPVEHPRGLRAERAVHERLQVAESEKVVSDPRAQTELREPADVLGRERLPDTQRQTVPLVDPSEDPVCAEPAVLVVDRADTALVRDAEPVAGPRHPLVLRHDDVPLAEAPGGLLAQHARRLAVRVALDDASVNLEIAAGAGERSRVEPERVVVLRPERGRPLPGDLVERAARRMLRPVGIAPAVTAEPLAPR